MINGPFFRAKVRRHFKGILAFFQSFMKDRLLEIRNKGVIFILDLVVFS